MIHFWFWLYEKFPYALELFCIGATISFIVSSFFYLFSLMLNKEPTPFLVLWFFGLCGAICGLSIRMFSQYFIKQEKE